MYIDRTSCRTRSILLLRFASMKRHIVQTFVIVGARAYVQPPLVFRQISLGVRFDNGAIRHRLLADSQMNEFVVNRRTDAPTHKSHTSFGCISIRAFGRFCYRYSRVSRATRQIEKSKNIFESIRK